MRVIKQNQRIATIEGTPDDVLMFYMMWQSIVWPTWLTMQSKVEAY